MTLIAVDIDDTLYPFNQLAREMIIDLALEHGDKRLQRGAYCAWGEWRSPVDVSDLGMWLEVIERCHSSQVIAEQVPFPRAAESLRELADAGYHLRYVSNRSPDAFKATVAWLLDNNFPFRGNDKLICTAKDKRPMLRECQYLIDDRPKTLVEFVYDFTWQHKHGSENEAKRRKAFGLYMPYNAALTDVPGIKLAPNWKLLRQYLMDQDVLTAAEFSFGI